MRAVIVVLCVAYLLMLLTGCVTLADRASSQPERHPCGNIWNVCPGDNEFIDRLSWVLAGHA